MLKRLTGSDARVELASLASVGLNLGATGIRWMLNVFLANALGTAGFGRFSVLRSTAGLLSKLPNLGYDLSLIRWLPQYRESGDGTSYRQLLRHAVRITAAAAVVVAVGASLFGWIQDDELTMTTLAASVLIIVDALTAVLRQELRAANRHVVGVWLTEAVHPVLFALFAVAVVVFVGASVSGVLWALALTGVVVIGLEVMTIAKHLPPRGGTASASSRDWRQGTGSLYLAQLGIAAQEVVYLLIVGYALGDIAAGVYTVGARIAILARMGNSAVETILSPEFGRLSTADEGGAQAMQAVVDKGIRLSMLFTGAAVAFLALAADYVIAVFGDGFDGAKAILIMLLIGNVANALSGPTGYLVSMTGSEVIYGYIMAGHAIVGTALGLVAADYFGTAVAVAAVSTITTVSWNTWLIVIGGRRLGVWCLPPLVRRLFGLGDRGRVGVD